MKAHRLFISVNDLVILTGHTYNACWKDFKIIKDSLGKKNNHKVTIDEYAKYEGISADEIKKALGILA